MSNTIKERLEYLRGELRVTEEQAQKGLDWLNNQRRTPAGRERKNNPFGYREEAVLDNPSYFTLSDLYDAMSAYGNQMGLHNYLPVYTLHSKSGETFSYYVQGHEINITG